MLICLCHTTDDPNFLTHSYYYHCHNSLLVTVGKQALSTSFKSKAVAIVSQDPTANVVAELSAAMNIYNCFSTVFNAHNTSQQKFWGRNAHRLFKAVFNG